jgi:hypothetical protein
MRSRRDIGLLCFGLACSALAAFQVQRGLVESAGPLLNNYELDLPPWLSFVLTYDQVAWALPLLVLIAWAAWPQKRWRGAAACTVGIGILALGLVPHMPFFQVAVTL